MEVVRIGKERLGEASDVLARAFHDDPAWVWLLPDEARRTRLLPWLFRVGFDVTAADVYVNAGSRCWARRGGCRRAAPRCASRRRCARSSRRRSGSARPPGRSSPTAARSSSSAPRSRAARTGTSPGSASTRGRSARASARRCSGPAWRPRLQRGLPTVLLTNNEANLPFYESQQFAVVRQGRTPEDGPKAWAMVRTTVTPSLPKRFPDRDEIAAVHAEADALETGAEGEETRRLAGPRARAARHGQARVPRPRRPQRPHPAALPGRAHRARSTCTSATSSARSASPTKSRRGEPSLIVDELVLLSRIRAPLPDTFHGLTDVEQRYRRRHLDLLMNEERSRGLHPPRADRLRGPAVPRRRRLHRGGDADPAASLRRGVRRAVRDASQRARPGSLSADRDRALSEAADRRRAREGLRDRQGLPQRGRHVQEQPRVHDARVVRGVRRLPGHDEPDREPDRVRGARDARHDEDDVQGARGRSEGAVEAHPPDRRARRARPLDARLRRPQAATRVARHRRLARQDVVAARRQGGHRLHRAAPDRSRRSSTTIRSSSRRSPASPTTIRRSSSASSTTSAGWSSEMRSPS